VEERRELDDLSVGAARDVGRFLEARALVFADQLDAVGELRLLGRPTIRGRRLVGYRENFGLLLVRGGNGRLLLDARGAVETAPQANMLHPQISCSA
jgi:hypothetical protein